MDAINNDSHSFARLGQSIITHLNWDARIDFNKKKIFATATYQIKKLPNAKIIVLDTKNLNIRSVVNGNNETLPFELLEPQHFLGQALKIQLSSNTKLISITYETNKSAEALQWLSPQQTADKTFPFLFTQSQAILARSWIPIQDSPGIRFTYDAKVEVPKNLIALMSANNPTKKNDSGIYNFKMEQPIPAYLLALSAGDLVYKPISDRSGVYAEPSVLDDALYEFEDLEKMISTAESLYGEYKWGKYDLLVLPPSFPFGGMENPKLTFATPTILAGDKSLTSLVAHELAHSWSGNLVTNATWDDFWLNEGFTVYFEYRIMEALYGREYSEMLASLSMNGLKEELESLPAEDTRLKLNLKGRNPDDGMTSIAYDKGYFFLRSLEEKFGREKFDLFLKTYFSQNAYQSITTEKFIEILNKQLIEEYQIDLPKDFLNEWIYTHGLPNDSPTPSPEKFKTVDKAILQLLKNMTASQMKDEFKTDQWSTHEWIQFVSELPNQLDSVQLRSLDEVFGFTKSQNSEIFSVWAKVSIQNNYQPCYPYIESFLIKTGRRKFLMPLYTALIQTEEGKKWAKEVYKKARPNYHYVASSSIDELLE